MTPFETAWAKTGNAEGGYSNLPNDPETNHGITIAVARAHGYKGAMIDLPKQVATDIAKKEYWDKHNLDAVAAISLSVALEIFDTSFNMWVGAGAKFFQRALNGLNQRGKWYPDVSVDGNIGPKTVAAFKTYLDKRGFSRGTTVMLRLLNIQQGYDYLRQATEEVDKEDFLDGWIYNRVVI